MLHAVVLGLLGAVGTVGLAASSDAEIDWLTAGDPAAAFGSFAGPRCWPGEYDSPGGGGGTPLCGVEIANGLVSRRFVLSPAFGTVDWIVNGSSRRGGAQSMFRAVTPEATITLNGSVFTVGGLETAGTDAPDFTTHFLACEYPRVNSLPG